MKDIDIRTAISLAALSVMALAHIAQILGRAHNDKNRGFVAGTIYFVALTLLIGWWLRR